jgi:hypothetical protein
LSTSGKLKKCDRGAPFLSSVICAGQPQHSEVQKIIMLTVDVEPKLKFMEAGAFCSWNIPTGLDFQYVQASFKPNPVLGYWYAVWGRL